MLALVLDSVFHYVLNGLLTNRPVSKERLLLHSTGTENLNAARSIIAASLLSLAPKDVDLLNLAGVLTSPIES